MAGLFIVCGVRASCAFPLTRCLRSVRSSGCAATRRVVIGRLGIVPALRSHRLLRLLPRVAGLFRRRWLLLAARFRYVRLFIVYRHLTEQ